MKALWAIPCLALLLSACSQQLAEEHKKGYDAGYADATVKLKNAYERRIADLETAHRAQMATVQSQLPKPSSTAATEICGVDGANVNGRHVDGGRTGCVRVYNDGRFEPY